MLGSEWRKAAALGIDLTGHAWENQPRCLASGMILSWASLVASGWVPSPMILLAGMRLTCLEAANFVVHDLPHKMGFRFQRYWLVPYKNHSYIWSFRHRTVLNHPRDSKFFLDTHLTQWWRISWPVHSSTKLSLKKVNIVIVFPTQLMRTEAWLIPKKKGWVSSQMTAGEAICCFLLLLISLIFHQEHFYCA